MNPSFRKQLFRSLFLSFVLIITVPGDSAAAEQKQNQGTFHKEWKKRNTPYKPNWGPSLCGGGKTVVPARKKISRAKRMAIKQRKKEDTKGVIQWKEYAQEEEDALLKLGEVFIIQINLLNAKDKLTEPQRERMLKRIEEKKESISKYISKAKKFPFKDEMGNMNKVVGDIQTGKLKSIFFAEDKKPEEILREIQKMQFRMIKQQIDDNIRKRKRAGD